MANGTVKNTTYMYRSADTSSRLDQQIYVGTIVGIKATSGSFYQISKNVTVNIANPYLKANVDTYYYTNSELTIKAGSVIKKGHMIRSNETPYMAGTNTYTVILSPITYYLKKSDFTEYKTETLSSVYVLKSDIEIIERETPTTTTTGTVVNRDGAYLFQFNNSQGSVIMQLPADCQIEILDIGRDTASSRAMSHVTATLSNGASFTGWIMSENGGVTGSNTTAYVSNNDVEPQTTKSEQGWMNAETDWVTLYNDWIQYQIDNEGITHQWDDPYYHRLSLRHFNTLGYPPKFNMDVDLQYTDQDSYDPDDPQSSGIDLTPGIGRVFGKTFLSNPPILSICPGKARMFPDLMGVKKDNFMDMMVNIARGDGNETLVNKILSDESGAFSGKLYRFEPDTQSYGYFVNALCRACAILMGIGDEKVPNLGSRKLKDFDYSYWSLRSDVTLDPDTDQDTSIFKMFFEAPIKNAKKIVSSLVEDTTYINFFLHGSETSVSESISTDIENSPLESIGVFNTLNSFGSTVNYFTGSGFTLGTDQSSIVQSIKEALGVGTTGLDGILDMGKNILKGGKIVLPKMLSSASYGKAISCNTRFISPYGDRLSVFLKCIIPICHLLALALPRQLSDNMYTYPFVVNANQLGQFNVDLGVVTNLNITRGGMDNTSWTINSLPTEWDVSFDIVPLVDELMMTGTNHPLLFAKNTGLLNYLGNMCGFDLIANNADTRMEITKSFIVNKFTGYPRAIENRIVDKLYRAVSRFTGLAW